MTLRHIDLTHYFRPVAEIHPGVGYSVQPGLYVLTPADDLEMGDIVAHKFQQTLTPSRIIEKVTVPVGKSEVTFFHAQSLLDDWAFRIPQYREGLVAALLMPFDPAKQKGVVTDIECKACKSLSMGG
jgi:hypothetical protein